MGTNMHATNSMKFMVLETKNPAPCENLSLEATSLWELSAKKTPHGSLSTRQWRTLLQRTRIKIKRQVVQRQIRLWNLKLANQFGFGFWTSPSASQEKLKQVAPLTWIQNQNSTPDPSHKAKKESNLKKPKIRIAQNNMASSKTTW